MIYIHIGLQKTGTTSLQYYLDKNNLLKFPIDALKHTKSNSDLFYSSGNQEFFYKCRRNNLKEIDFKNFLMKDTIITCENFSNPSDNLKSLKNLLSYLSKTKNKFTIILTLRDFEDYCKSMYAEAVTNSFVCEMRSFKNYRNYLERYLNNLNQLLMDYPLKKFNYSKEINSEIIQFMTNKKFMYKNLFMNKKNKNYKYNIRDLEKLAYENRLKGWIPNYRIKLRRNFKNESLQAPIYYIFLTYLRSLYALMGNVIENVLKFDF